MKKGISLIVLVITIIVMIIIAGAIILSLNSSNVTGKATWAAVASDRANLQSEFAVVLADVYSTDAYDTNDNGMIEKTELLNSARYQTWANTVTGHFKIVGNETTTDLTAVSVVYTGPAIAGAPTTNVPAWYTPTAK